MSESTPAHGLQGWRHTVAMLKIGVIGFGGGSALIPVMEKELVRPGGLTESEFVQDTVIANITPGALPVKLAALSGARLGGARLALSGAIAVAIPGAAATMTLLAVFAQLGPRAISSIEFASLGITAFIIYLLGHYVMKVIAPQGRLRWIPLVIALAAFLATGLDKTVGVAAEIAGVERPSPLPELSALTLVLLTLLAISVLSLWQYFRGHQHAPTSDSLTAPRPHQTRRALRVGLAFTALAAVAVAAGLAVPPVAESVLMLGTILLSTLTSFGGGEAYVGVADGFFVASGSVDKSVFYGQIVPVANALPGPILVKIAGGLAFILGQPFGWLLAAAAVLTAIASCSALAVFVLAGYDRARNSLLMRNISTFILPVICGLLGSTAVSMLHSNARIAGEAGVPAWATVLGSVVLAAIVPLLHRVVRVPDIVLIVVFGGLSLLVLSSLP